MTIIVHRGESFSVQDPRLRNAVRLREVVTYVARALKLDLWSEEDLGLLVQICEDIKPDNPLLMRCSNLQERLTSAARLLRGGEAIETRKAPRSYNQAIIRVRELEALVRKQAQEIEDLNRMVKERNEALLGGI